MTQVPYSNELELIIKWCREFLNPMAKRHVSDWTEMDLQNLLYLVRKHRISGLVPYEPKYWLNQPDTLKELKAFNKKKRQHALLQGATLLELKQVFGDAGIEFLVMKGLPLSQKLYGDIAFRSSRDIDIMVQPKDLMKCHLTLKKQGFVQRAPSIPLTEENNEIFRKRANQIAYHNSQGVQLELHWRLFKKKNTISGDTREVWNHTKSTKILDQDFIMLDDRCLFQYLYIHGARHQYLSLFWLLDFATCCKNLHQDELEWHVEFAKKNDIDRFLFLSLALTHKLFGLDFGVPYPKNRRLEKQLKLVDRHLRSEIGRESTISNNFKSVAYQMSLKKSFSYKIDYFELYSINDYEVLPLPKALTGFYFILRPFLFALRYLSKRGK